MERIQTVAGHAGSTLVAALFAMAGTNKIAGNMVDVFVHFGLPGWFSYVTGGIEVVAAVLLLVPVTRFYGAALLVATMIGATVSHLGASEVGPAGFTAVLGLTALALGWSRRPRFEPAPVELPAK